MFTSVSSSFSLRFVVLAPKCSTFGFNLEFWSKFHVLCVEFSWAVFNNVGQGLELMEVGVKVGYGILIKFTQVCSFLLNLVQFCSFVLN